MVATASGSGAAQRPLPERLDAYLRGRPDGPFMGVVLIARGPTILFERGYGPADADLGIAVEPSMRFGIGSLTKPMTATAVMRLVERGLMRLSDPIGDYLRVCPPAWRSATIRDLLSHTSGIPDLFGEMRAAPVDSTRGVIDGVASRHLGDSLLAVPGSKYAYSNFNYCLLGYAMEAAAHASWPELMAREVFAPAGMTRTAYDDVWQIMPGRVRGYRRAEHQLRHIAYHDHAAYAAGGLLSTARDLLAFDRAFSSGRLVADSTMRRMTTPGPGDYGLGWQMITVLGRHQRNHSGGTGGFASHLVHYDDGTTIIVLSNDEEESAKSTACDLAAIVFGLAPSRRDRGENPCRPDP